MRKYNKIICKILIVIMIFLCPVISTQAASTIKLKYDGKTVNYTGKQVSYYLDGKKINLTNIPGVIFNGISLVSYKEVFANALGATCKYDSSTGTITISQYGNTIKMTIGSRTGYINGKKTTLSIAPKKIQYVNANTTKVTVPARNVAEALGYKYVWTSSKSRVDITGPYQIAYNGTWYKYTGAQGKVTVDGNNINVTKMPSIIIDNTTLVQANLVFTSKYIGAKYKYDATKKQVTITKGDTKIVFKLNSKTATVNGESFTLDTAPQLIKNNIYKVEKVMVPGKFTAEMLGYAYDWNSSTKTSVITTKVEDPEENEDPEETEEPEDDENIEDTENDIEDDENESPELGDDAGVSSKPIDETWEVKTSTLETPFTNILQKIHAYTDSNGNEIIELTGLNAITPIITENPSNKNILYIDIDLLQNPIGDIYAVLQNNSYVKNMSISYITNTTLRIQLEKVEDCEYYGVQSGTIYSLLFSKKKIDVNNTDYAVVIPKPSQVSFSSIKDEDQYLNNRIVLTLPENYTDYYNTNKISINKGNITVNHSVNSSGKTEIIINTSTIQGYKLVDTKDSISLIIDDPRNIYSKIVILDPGHGGSDPGTNNISVKEKEVTYNILYQYGKEYFNGSNSTIKAYWTRVDDTYVSLTDRAKFAEKVGADLFISLHLNSATSTTANGTETYYTTTNNNENDMGLTSKALATYIQNNLPKALNLSSTRGVKTANFVVTKNNTVPAVLVELGFISNSSDLEKLIDRTFQQNTAKEMYTIIKSIFDIYPTGR